LQTIKTKLSGELCAIYKDKNMSESKIQIKVGHVEFSGEGNQDWLSSQLDKILDKVPDLLKIELANNSNGGSGSGDGGNSGGSGGNGGAKLTNLASFLKQKNATSNQTKKFLATAAFLQQNGRESMGTNDVTKTLEDGKQGKLTNPALCLINNVKKGYCEKKGKDFYVTPEGFTSLGISTE